MMVLAVNGILMFMRSFGLLGSHGGFGATRLIPGIMLGSAENQAAFQCRSSVRRPEHQKLRFCEIGGA